MRRIFFSTILFLSAAALSACAMLDRPYYLRHWEQARLSSAKERVQRHWQAAEKLAKEAVLQAKHFGYKDFRLAVSLNDLAQIYLLRNKPKLALPLLKESLEVLNASYVKGNSRLVNDLIRQEKAVVLRSLADISFDEESYQQAEKYYLASYEILSACCSECISDRGNPLAIDYVKTCFGLAQSQERLNKLEDAEKNYRSALTMASNNNLPDQERVRERLKGLYERRGLKEESARLDAGKRWSNLAVSARKAYSAGSYPEARSLYEKALVEAKDFESRDFRRAVNYKGLADCAHRLGDNGKQEEYVLLALGVLKSMPNSMNALKDDLLSDLARNYELSARDTLLKPVLLEQLALRESSYSSKIAQTCSELAAVELRLGQRVDAKRQAERALKLFLLEPTNKRAVAAALSRLGVTFFQLQDYESAATAIEASIKITAEHLHLKDARPVLAYFQLKELYALEGKSKQAEESKADALSYLSGLQARRYVDTAAGLEGFVNEALVSGNSMQALAFGRDVLDVAAAMAGRADGEPGLVKQMSEIAGRVKQKLSGLKN